MRRCSGSHLLLVLILLAGLAATGCGGGHTLSTTAPVATITLAPVNASADLGGVVQFVVSEKGANGQTLFHPATFASDNPNIDIANNGLACGGKWDSLTAPVVCTPAAGAQIANITATSQSVTSAPVTFFVHQHVDLVTLSPSIVPPSCKSQTQTQQYTASAFHNGVDITSTVGGFNFLIDNTTVATINTADQPTGQPNNQITAKAANPGKTALVATVSGTSSLGSFFTTCGPFTISLHVQSVTDTAFTIATAATKQLAADVVDTAGNTMTGVTLVYSSTSAAASATSTGLVNGLAPGQASIVASCTPGNCNPGVNVPVYSNPVVATITGTAAATKVFVTSTQFVSGPAPGPAATTVVIPIPTDTNTPGTALPLPPINTVQVVPNSILVSQGGSKVFIGSPQGLNILDTSTGGVTQVTSTPGRVVSVSPDAVKVIVADDVNNLTYVFNSSQTAFDTLQISGVTSAVWTPDALKAYLVAGTNLYQYAPSILSLRTIPIGDTGKAAGMLPQFAYIATASGNLGARSTCRNDSTYAPEGGITTDTGLQFLAGVYLASGTSNTLKMLDVGGTKMSVDTPTIAAPPAGQSCPPTITSSSSSADWTGSGIASFTPRQLIALNNGTQAYVLSDQTVLLGYDVVGNTTFTVPVSSATQFTGGALLSGAKLYFGGSDGVVHVIDTATKLQTTTIPINFTGTVACAGTVCKPDLVVVQPK
jgi:hypothetical protein